MVYLRYCSFLTKLMLSRVTYSTMSVLQPLHNIPYICKNLYSSYIFVISKKYPQIRYFFKNLDIFQDLIIPNLELPLPFPFSFFFFFLLTFLLLQAQVSSRWVCHPPFLLCIFSKLMGLLDRTVIHQIHLDTRPSTARNGLACFQRHLPLLILTTL
jgi:hypothetical protein